MKFYINDDLKADMKISDKKRWAEATEVDRKNGDAERCPLCGRYVSTLKWLEPRKIKLSNTRYPDRLCWLSDFIVSERFKKEYINNGLSGIESFSSVEVVKVAHRKDTSIPIPKYFSAKINYNKSVRKNPKETISHGSKYDWSCELCNPFGSTCNTLDRLVLDTNEWDGTDVMRVYSVGGYIFSERFYEFVNKNKFTNFNLVPVEEYTIEMP